jgi:hypothetical protein
MSDNEVPAGSGAPNIAYSRPPIAIANPGKESGAQMATSADVIGYGAAGGQSSGPTGIPAALNLGIGLDTNKPGDADGVGQVDFTYDAALSTGTMVEPPPTDQPYDYPAKIQPGVIVSGVPAGYVMRVVYDPAYPTLHGLRATLLNPIAAGGGVATGQVTCRVVTTSGQNKTVQVGGGAVDIPGTGAGDVFSGQVYFYQTGIPAVSVTLRLQRIT